MERAEVMEPDPGELGEQERYGIEEVDGCVRWAVVVVADPAAPFTDADDFGRF